MALADPASLRLLIVDDVRLYREGLAAIMSRESGVREVVTARDAASAIALLDHHDPDVVLVNVAGGNHAPLHLVRAHRPEIAIVALGVSEAEEDVIACAEAGVAGYLLRTEPLDHLLPVVRSVVAGESLCSPRTSAMLLRRVQSLAAQRVRGPRAPSLTAREDDVLRLLDLGLSNQEISERLGITVRTVKNHVHNILEKVGARRRGEAVAAFRRQVPAEYRVKTG
ncbi:two component transcriptional regulator, LuxR family [Micromonospora pattaloongensis]|uniref:Two component transcriptional regulator, LuxR family n=2 Tax=Micromonospora pattaloongensis TaxID=405436 RepID=A0A1H3QMG1_9ACTN|nr:two component transcriptional regulator, LuxR family [Micromonospora pattaloongensis]